MNRIRLSLFYLASYLLGGGIGFLAVPRTMLRLFLSNGQYSDVMVRLVGLLLLGLGIVVVEIIRQRVAQLYPTTLIIRAVILVGLLSLYFGYGDPLMLVLFAIVGIGFAMSLTCLVLDRDEGERFGAGDFG
jgi:uncharacterized protein YjeT (DUF2065 family)